MDNNKFWFLHHFNALAHISLVLRDHFAKKSTHIVPQSPNSPDEKRIQKIEEGANGYSEEGLIAMFPG